MDIQLIGGATEVRIATAGTFFLLDDTSAPVKITFYFHGQRIGEAENIEAPYYEDHTATRNAGFTEIGFTSETSQTISIVVRDRARVGTQRIAGTVQAVPLPGKTVTANADQVEAAAGPVLVSAANANRQRIDIAATVDFRWGGATVDATHGVPVPAGMLVSIETGGEVWVYLTAAGTISTTEVLK